MATHRRLYVQDALYAAGDIVFADGPFSLTTGASLTSSYALTYPPTPGAVNSIIANPAGNGILSFTAAPTLTTLTFTGAPPTQSITAILTADPAPISRAFSLFSTAAGAVVATLPTAAAAAGQCYHIALITAGNNLTITAAGGDLIEGAATVILNVADQHISLCSIGNNKWIIV